MQITKKAWPKFFQAILDGDKTFDMRLADFNCKVGDTLILKEWDPKTKSFTGRQIKKQVTYVLKTKDIPPFFTQEEIDKFGFQIISFK
jgi:uncharacterized protein DUF3850